MQELKKQTKKEKNMKIKNFLTLMLAVTMCSVGPVNAYEVDGNYESSITALEDQIPEYTRGYDEAYVDLGTIGAIRIYETGSLFNFWRSRSGTEVIGAQGEDVPDYEAYAYASICNENTSSFYESFETEMDSNRVCGTKTSYINPSYATSLEHVATLKENGVMCWTKVIGTYSLPASN